MMDNGADGTTVLAMNVLLGALVMGGLVTIAVAVIRDVVARRRMHGRMPDSWPPTPRDRRRSP